MRVRLKLVFCLFVCCCYFERTEEGKRDKKEVIHEMKWKDGIKPDIQKSVFKKSCIVCSFIFSTWRL